MLRRGVSAAEGTDGRRAGRNLPTAQCLAGGMGSLPCSSVKLAANSAFFSTRFCWVAEVEDMTSEGRRFCLSMARRALGSGESAFVLEYLRLAQAGRTRRSNGKRGNRQVERGRTDIGNIALARSIHAREGQIPHQLDLTWDVGGSPLLRPIEGSSSSLSVRAAATAMNGGDGRDGMGCLNDPLTAHAHAHAHAHFATRMDG